MNTQAETLEAVSLLLTKLVNGLRPRLDATLTASKCEGLRKLAAEALELVLNVAEERQLTEIVPEQVKVKVGTLTVETAVRCGPVVLIHLDDKPLLCRALHLAFDAEDGPTMRVIADIVPVEVAQRANQSGQVESQG